MRPASIPYTTASVRPVTYATTSVRPVTVPYTTALIRPVTAPVAVPLVAVQPVIIPYGTASIGIVGNLVYTTTGSPILGSQIIPKF